MNTVQRFGVLPGSYDNIALQSTMKKFREQFGLTQQAAADLLGIPRRTVENIEFGRGHRYEKLITLAIKQITDHK